MPRGRVAVYAAVLLAFLDNFALLPLIAPRAQELGADAIGVGLAVAAYSLTNLVLNLLGGSLTDRFGRRPVVLLSLAGSPICIALYGLAPTLAVFLAVRVLHGALGGALMVSLFALLGDLAPEGRRGAAIGRAGALIGLAGVIGPAGAGLAANALGSTATLLGLAVVLAVGLGLVWLALPETLPVGAIRERTPGTWGRLLSDPRIRVACLTIFGLEVAVGVVTGFLKDGIIERGIEAGMDPERALRYATGAQGGLFSIFAVIAIVLMLSPLARTVDRRGIVGVGVVGLLAAAAATTVLALSSALSADIIGIALYGVGFGLVFPASAAMVGIAAPVAERGRAYGLWNVAFDAGLVAGPLVAGFAATGLDAAPFWVATAMLLVAAVLVVPFARTRRGGLGLEPVLGSVGQR